MLRRHCLLVACVALVGCETVPEQPAPAPTGPRARLDETAKVHSASKADFFVVTEVDGRQVGQKVEFKGNSKLGFWEPAGSEGASAGRLIAGAATLFLLPMKQTNDYSFEFEVECRGRSMGQWVHNSTLEQTQFLLADPHRGLPALIKDAVAQFIRQASESGKLDGGCA